jgi:hypothetical protein
MKRFSDLPPSKREAWAEKKKISEVIGKEIIITGFSIIQSKYGNGGNSEALRIEFEQNGSKYICYTASSLLRRQLEATEDELPYIATIEEKNHWLTLT